MSKLDALITAVVENAAMAAKLDGTLSAFMKEESEYRTRVPSLERDLEAVRAVVHRLEKRNQILEESNTRLAQGHSEDLIELMARQKRIDDFSKKLTELVRERDEVVRERDALKAENKRMFERAQQEKIFNLAPRYSSGLNPFKYTAKPGPSPGHLVTPWTFFGVDAAKPDADKFVFTAVRAGKTTAAQAATQARKLSSAQIDLNCWETMRVIGLTPEAIQLGRLRVFTPTVRRVDEWNLSAENIKNKLPERHGFRWTRSEEEKLVADYCAQKSLDHFTRMHKRHADAIVRRIAKLVNFSGMAKCRRWESEDDYTARLLRMYFPASYSRFTSVLRKPGFEPKYTTYTG